MNSLTPHDMVNQDGCIFLLLFNFTHILQNHLSKYENKINAEI